MMKKKCPLKPNFVPLQLDLQILMLNRFYKKKTHLGP